MINHQNLHILYEKNVLDEAFVRNAVVIDAVQLDDAPTNRKQQRQAQSLAARDLLSNSLTRLYGKDKITPWSLVKSQSGKPFLQGDASPAISIAHSGDWVVCAVAASNAVGVDIETIRPRNWEKHYQDLLHPLEISWVLNGSGDEKPIRELTCWCRKEAVVKALGIGMTVPLSEIGFSPAGTLIALPRQLGSPSGWMTYSTVVQGKAVVAAAWKC